MPPVCEVGQVVEKGQVLGIGGSLLADDEIEAEFRCKMFRFARENTQAVEFGDPLFVIERGVCSNKILIGKKSW